MISQLQLIGLLIILWGGYLLAAGIFGWRRALRGRLMRGIVRLVGPVGTRILYALGGVALIVAGILYMSSTAP
ncbi:MAG: hypothetical protein JXN59_12780 [Anaerolineae bacterium]|nr:hypothetical protein [Anaerolineae bacterium]